MTKNESRNFIPRPCAWCGKPDADWIIFADEAFCSRECKDKSYSTGNDAASVTTTTTVSAPLSFYEGVADCMAGRTVPLDIALTRRPPIRFKPWQLVGPLGVLR